jgi:hypothetical protein
MTKDSHHAMMRSYGMRLRGVSSTVILQDEFDERGTRLVTLIEVCGLWRPIGSAPQDTLVFLKRFERVTFGMYDTRNDPKMGYRPGWLSYDGGFPRRAPPLHWSPVPVILQDWHVLAAYVKRFGLPCAH